MSAGSRSDDRVRAARSLRTPTRSIATAALYASATVGATILRDHGSVDVLQSGSATPAVPSPAQLQLTSPWEPRAPARASVPGTLNDDP